MARKLPSRTKPETLHKVCRYLSSEGDTEKGRLYDELDVDRRQIRGAIDYGTKLGFIEFDGETATNTERGRYVGYADSLDESAVTRLFREGIESYEPYREAFLWVYSDDALTETDGDKCIKQNAFQSALDKATGESQTRREVNLLIKTADAAGLGEFITGRRGRETRLNVADEFNEFMQKLINDYEVPEAPEPETSEKESSDVDSANGDDDTIPVIEDGHDSGSLTIKKEWNLEGYSPEEIADLIQKIQKFEVEVLEQ